MAGKSIRKVENSMPVELAIQRELEHRRIAAAFHLPPNTNSTQEVKSSNDASNPKPLPGPSSMEFSSLSGTKRKESPAGSTHHPRLQHQQPFHGSLNNEVKTGAWDFSLKVTHSNDASHPKSFPGPSSSEFSSLSGTKPTESPTRSVHCTHPQGQQPFHRSLNHEAKSDDTYCKVCQISCSSPFNLKQHLKGRKHRKLLQNGRNNQMQWCEVCSISCMNEDLLKLHFQGQKHKAKLQMLEINKQGGEAPNIPKWCGLCKLWCSDEFAFKQHLEGKKHTVHLHAVEKEKEKER